MTICSVIPVFIVRKKCDIHLNENVSTWISFGNCLAGGVFLGMCFLGLFPYVHEKFTEVLINARIETQFPLAEFVIIIGFFLIFFIEHFIIAIRINLEKDNIVNEDAGRLTHISYKKDLDDESYVSLLEADEIEQDVKDLKVTVEKPLHSTNNFHHTDGTSDARVQHSHCDVTFAVNKSTGLRRIILLVALSIHSVFEGMMLGLQTDYIKVFHLCLAILLHEVLVALALGVNIAKLNLGLLKSLKYILMVTGSIPFGIVLGMLIRTAPGLAGVAVSAVLQGLAAGIFIHVTFMEIIPEELASGKNRLLKIIFFFIGFIVMAVVNFALGSH
ncbi:Zinc transporter ZIP3 [Blattella germanica]|nr:Zinc transporter ZIP3 [Blattella germanica]